jgi:N6-adenosine-specific RNA methylase IME4
MNFTMENEKKDLLKMCGGKKYSVIYADPAWKYKNESPPCLPEKQPDTCKIEYYYPTMPLEEIKALPVKEISEKDAVLFLWATTPAIQEAFEVMTAWGFKYKTMITWEKTNRDCMGYWFRTCTEHLIVAVRGKVKAFRCMERTAYQEKRTKHSKKPERFYELIEQVTKGERIELFARKKRAGWDCWGNEIDATVLKGREIFNKSFLHELSIEEQNEALHKADVMGSYIDEGCENCGALKCAGSCLEDDM